MGKNDRSFLFKVVGILLLLLILVIFALRNNEIVSVDFVFVVVEISLAFLILISALLGAIIVGGILSIKTLATSSQNSKLKKTSQNKYDRISELEAKIAVLESEKRSTDRSEI